ncbi:MAG: hypothetical protein H3C31_12780, partial [Brumimicrobium sp.]|nr:hypothetical protein [Brumimicrobium sp.]
HYTAEFWEYSPRLGKRWNIDPVVKPHESPYAAFANNPIWFVDPNGADTSFFDDKGNYDQQAKNDFTTAYNRVKTTIESIKSDISTNQTKLNKDKWFFPKLRNKNLSKKISGLESNLNDWQKLETNFDDIISSPTLFIYSSHRGEIDAKLSGLTGSDKDVWNSKEGRWDVVHIFVEGGKDEIVIHESRHGYQRLKDPAFKKQYASKLVRELDAYTYQKIYNAKSVENFIENQRYSKYGHIQENVRPNMTLEEAIKEFYDE